MLSRLSSFTNQSNVSQLPSNMLNFYGLSALCALIASVSCNSLNGRNDDFVCPADRGYFPHDTFCHAYFICYQGKPQLNLCAEGELFDDNNLQCVDRSAVDCGSRKDPDGKYDPCANNVCGTEATCQVKASGSKDYVCVCPDTSATYDESTKRCIPTFIDPCAGITCADGARCEMNVNAPPNHICLCPDPNDFYFPSFQRCLSNPCINRDCGNEAHCEVSVDELTGYKCMCQDANDIYQPSSKTCLADPCAVRDVCGIEATCVLDGTKSPAYHCKCPSPNDVYEASSKTCKNPTGKIECKSRYGLFPHPTDKQLYISCQEFYPHIMSCPDDLVFDPSLKVCNWE